MNWALALLLVATSLTAAVLGIAGTYLIERRSRTKPVSIFSDFSASTLFLFDGETLVDSTPSARTLLTSAPPNGSVWQRLMSYLAPHFQDLEAQFARLATEGAITLASTSSNSAALLLQAELRGGLTKVTLIDPDRDEKQSSGYDTMAQRAMVEELELLRATLAKAPILIWRERGNGDILWANSAYLLRTGDIQDSGQELTWPLPRLFEKLAGQQGATGQRKSLALRGGDIAWYDLTSSVEGEDRLVFAAPVDSAVKAETALRDFMQTLTKTFAHLHVGLAIFDHRRQLHLFNPALMDLTGLPVDFLSMRPSLLSVLDAMRDRSMIPEPKDYRDWRRQLIEMEKAAASGLYEDTWSLPGGQTYRVIGRPHPNGALALMIEDISGEMLRTRRYRADLELGQSVIDEMEEAIAVFSPAGQLAMSNAAYQVLWGGDPSTTLADVSLRTLCAEWRNRCSPSAIWADLEDFASNQGGRTGWQAEARLLDGRLVSCRFAPLSGGATLTAFRLPETGVRPKQLIPEDAALRSA